MSAINQVASVGGTFSVLNGRNFTFANPANSLTVGGTLSVGGGAAASTLSVPDSVNLTNFSSGTLTGGTFQALANGTLDLGSRAVTTNAATVILNGSTSTFAGINSLATNTSGGSLQVLGGNSFTLVPGFVNAGAITVGTGSSLNLTGLSQTGTVTNSGTATWTGAADITGSGTGKWTNNAGSLFDSQNDQSFTVAGGSPTFVNNGIFQKSAGTGTTTMAWQFTNGGTVNVQSGVISFTAGGTFSGKYTLAANTAVSMDGGSFTTNGSTISGTGAVNVNGATLTISSALVTFAFNFNGGLINAGSGALHVQGPMTWGGGTFTGAAGVVSTDGIALTGAVGDMRLNGLFFRDGSDRNVWSGGSIVIDNGGAFTNTAFSTFTVTGDNSIVRNVGTPGDFENFTGAIFQKTGGTGTTTIGSAVTFNNTGTVDVQTGTLSISGGGTNAGTYNAASGATISVDNSVISLNSGAVITGTGTFRVTGGLTVNVPVSASNLLLQGGNIQGAGPLNVNGPFTWSSGSIVGSVAANGGGSLTGATGAMTIDAGVFTVGGGTLNWSAGTLTENGNATLTISPGGTLLATGDNNLTVAGGGTQTFTNGGVFRKEGGSGITSVSVPTSNGSLVEVLTGTLTFSAGLTNSGTVSVAPGAVLNGTLTSIGSAAFIRGGGTYGGPIIDNAGSTLAPGNSPGTMSVSGAATLNAGSFLQIELDGPSPGSGYDQLIVGGAITLNNPTLDFTLGYSAAPTDTFTFLTSGSMSGQFNNLPEGSTVPLGVFAGLTWTAEIHYGNNFVELVDPVGAPEPSSALLLLGASAVAVGWRRASGKLAKCGAGTSAGVATRPGL
jgi:hypothetical protein